MHLVGFIIRIYHDARSPARRRKKKFRRVLDAKNHGTFNQTESAVILSIITSVHVRAH